MENIPTKKSKPSVDFIIAIALVVVYLVVNWSKFYSGVLAGMKDF